MPLYAKMYSLTDSLRPPTLYSLYLLGVAFDIGNETINDLKYTKRDAETEMEWKTIEALFDASNNLF